MLNPEKIDKYFKFHFFLSTVVLTTFCLFLLNRLYKVESYLAGLPRISVEEGKKEAIIQKIDTCGEDCKRQINASISAAISTISATPKTVVKTPPAPEAARGQTAYVPLSGPITTTSMDWVDAAGTDVYIDLANDYGRGATATWEAFLQVVNGNGQAFARLYDVTHGIAVNGSEVSTTSGSSTQVSSGGLSFWVGKNLYRVQLKSLNSFVATFASGRIKVSY